MAADPQVLWLPRPPRENRAAILCLVFGLLIGYCFHEAHQDKPKWQLDAGSGRLFLLNTHTGEVLIYHPTYGWQPHSSAR